MMSKSFFTSFFIQSIGFQQLVLQWGRAMGVRRGWLTYRRLTCVGVIGGPTFMRMHKASFQMMVIVRDCFVAVV